MADEVFIPKERTANTLAAEAVSSGSVIVTPDTAELFVDLSGGRVKISDVVELANDAARTALLAPLNKFYFVKATGKLWRWDGSAWVNPPPPAHTHTYADIINSGSVGAGQDLNNYTAPGDYAMVAGSGLLNAPRVYWTGRLEVRTRLGHGTVTNSNYVYQRLLDSTYTEYRRIKKSDGTWTDWEKAINISDLAAATAVDACSLFGTAVTPPELLGKYTKQSDGSYVNAASAGNGGYVIRLGTSGTWEIFSTDFSTLLWSTNADVEHPWQVDAWVAAASSFATGTPQIIQL